MPTVNSGSCRVGVTHAQGVGVGDSAVPAVLAQVVVLAHRAAVTAPRFDLVVAVVAGAGKGRRVWVVQVVQHHHAAVFGPPQGVELVVIALAERQELLHVQCQAQSSSYLHWFDF